MNNIDSVRKRLTSCPGDLNVEGHWLIYGESPNPDFLWNGYKPGSILEVAKGKYSDVVEHALKLRGFFSWGYGGRIERAFVVEVTSTQKTKSRKKT